MHVLSLSIDGTIATRGSESHKRQHQYAAHFSRFTVITKTDEEIEGFVDSELEVVPVHYSTRLCFVYNAYRAASKICRTQDIDVITVQSPLATEPIGWMLSRRFDIPLHVSVVIDFPNEAWRTESWEHLLYDPIIRFVLKRADAIRVDTEIGKWKIRRLVGMDIPITVVPVHMDINQIENLKSRGTSDRLQKELTTDDRPVVLFAGRFVYQKNLKQWMSVAEQVINQTKTDPVFVLVGDGPMREWLVDRIDTAELNRYFRLPGWVSREELAAYYKLADVLLMTSRYEGACRVIIEAGVNELPVVATPFAGAQDNIINGQTGYVEGTTDTLANRIITLLESSDRRQSFGQAAREHLRGQVESETLVDRYAQSIRQAVR